MDKLKLTTKINIVFVWLFVVRKGFMEKKWDRRLRDDVRDKGKNRKR